MSRIFYGRHFEYQRSFPAQLARKQPRYRTLSLSSPGAPIFRLDREFPLSFYFHSLGARPFLSGRAPKVAFDVFQHWGRIRLTAQGNERGRWINVAADESNEQSNRGSHFQHCDIWVTFCCNLHIRRWTNSERLFPSPLFPPCDLMLALKGAVKIEEEGKERQERGSTVEDKLRASSVL